MKKYYVVTEANGFEIYSMESRSKEKLVIKEIDLEQPGLYARTILETEIKKKVAKFFGCKADQVFLEHDEKFDKKICSIIVNNKLAFDSE